MTESLEKYQTASVFGVSNELINSYVERRAVDEEFNRALELRKHIIVFGSSKQGKTSLIKKHLHPNFYIKIECSPDQKKVDIYKSILRQLGVEILEARNSSTEDSLGANIEAKMQIKLPLFGGGEGGAGGNVSTTQRDERTLRSVEYNIGVAQDIIEILKKLNFQKYILLENFHYLEEDTQKEVSFDLRNFQDENINFVILGIWREKNRLTQYNGDLQDRIIEIPVEPWNKEDLQKVITEGSRLLNINMDEIENQIIGSSFDSVGVLQELCKEACLAASIKVTVDSLKNIVQADFNRAVGKKLTDYSGRHIRSLEALATPTQTTTREGGDMALFIPYYFVRILLEVDFQEIVEGIKREKLHAEINKMHHRGEGVRAGDISNFLHTVIQLQIRKNIRPPLFDYDRNIKTLRVIDSTFYFFLRHTDRDRILNDISDPSEDARSTIKSANPNKDEGKLF